MKETMKDLDFIVIGPGYIKQGRSIKVLDVLSSGDRKTSIIVSYRDVKIQVDIFNVIRKELPFALMHFTGSKQYNIRVRAYVKRLGYTLNQYGLFDHKGNNIADGIKTERGLTKLIGITHRDPCDRNE
jgi:DNA polymerase (family 10)